MLRLLSRVETPECAGELSPAVRSKWKNGYNEHMAVPILKEPPITNRDAFIPYLMTALNMLAPIFAAYSVLRPHVLVTTIILILLGVPCSVYFRQRGYNRIVLNLITTIPLLILTWALVRTHPGLQFDWANPLTSMLSHESQEQLDGMLHVFAVLAAGRAFLLITSADLLQTPLPGISIFLLAVIAHHELDSDPLPLFCLLLLFISSAYLFSHEQHQQWFTIHTPPRIQRQLLTWMVFFALLLFPVVLMLGMNLQGFNMTAVASRMDRRPFGGMRNLFGLAGQTGIALSDEVEMGGLDWPRGKQPIMSVIVPRNTSQTLLWRAATYDYYTENEGRWRSTIRGSEQSAYYQSYSDRGEGWARNTEDNYTTVQIYPAWPYSAGPASDPGIVEAIKENKLTVKGNTILQTIKTKATMPGNVVPFYGAFQIIEVKGIPNVLQQAHVTADGAVLGRVMEMVDSGYKVTSLLKPLPTMIRLNITPLSCELA